MKTGLPEKVKESGEDFISQALDMDITHQLNLFEVEYQLLHEEMIDIKQNRERYEKLEVANKALNQKVNDLKCELDYVKENADMNARKLNCLNVVNEELRSRIKELEIENHAFRINTRFKNCSYAHANSNVVSPASFEVDDIMHGNHSGKKDHTDGQVTMEKSWELVPSPTTVNMEMNSMGESFDCNFPSSIGSSSGQSSVSDFSEGRKGRQLEMANSKSISTDSCDSIDLISFEAKPPKSVVSSSERTRSSSDDAMVRGIPLDEKEAKPLATKKRPVLPHIQTTSLETYKGEN